MTKRCPHCDQRLPLGAFYVAKDRGDGRSGYCRACSRLRGGALRSFRMAAGLCLCGRRTAPGWRSCRICLVRGRQATGSKPWRPGGRGRPPALL